jgi:predicted ArsR family transcriptional regulator
MVDTNEVAISHLQRRKIEGRVLIPFIDALREKIGEDAASEIVDETIRKLAIADGTQWAASYGRTLQSLQRVVRELWSGGGGMDVEAIDASEARFDFNVTRCGYAEFYQEQGRPDLGFQIHCRRDYAMLDGFNGEVELTRGRTIMQGAACCEFRFRKPDGPGGAD